MALKNWDLFFESEKLRILNIQLKIVYMKAEWDMNYSH